MHRAERVEHALHTDIGTKVPICERAPLFEVPSFGKGLKERQKESRNVLAPPILRQTHVIMSPWVETHGTILG